MNKESESQTFKKLPPSTTGYRTGNWGFCTSKFVFFPYTSLQNQRSFRFSCCRKEDPFQGPKLGSCLTLGNELPEETHVLIKQEILLGKGPRVESSRVRKPLVFFKVKGSD